MNNNLASNYRQILWPEHTGVGAKWNHIRCNVRGKHGYHPGKGAEKDRKPDVGPPMPVHDFCHQVPWVP